MQTPLEHIDPGTTIVVRHLQDSAKYGKRGAEFAKAVYSIDRQMSVNGKIILQMVHNAEFPESFDETLEAEMHIATYL